MAIGVAAAPALAGTPQTGLRTIALALVTADGRAHRYRVEVAATPAEQATGMMHRRRVPPGTGMLFPRSPPAPAAFWMHDTLVPLDMVFVAPGGTVESIAESVTPRSDAITTSRGRVEAVLELGGGEAARIGLRPGDAVRYRLPGVPPAPRPR